ncbi:MAG: twitching motility protein PilT [bacterium]|nr:twitching motility protein PilT [bacterium]
MVQIVAGEKGKGKTKLLIAKANEDVLQINGNLVYIDKSNRHMYELSNKIRLINSNDYFVSNADEFIGFLCGVISSNHDLEKIYVDSFLKLAYITEENIEPVLTKLLDISNHFKVDIVVCISSSKKKIPDNFLDSVIIAL